MLRKSSELACWRVLPGPDSGLPIIYATDAVPVTLGTPLYVRVRVQTLGDGRNHYCFKHWSADAPEPAMWAVEALNPRARVSRWGSLALVAHNTNVVIHAVAARRPFVSEMDDPGR